MGSSNRATLWDALSCISTRGLSICALSCACQAWWLESKQVPRVAGSTPWLIAPCNMPSGQWGSWHSPACPLFSASGLGPLLAVCQLPCCLFRLSQGSASSLMGCLIAPPWPPNTRSLLALCLPNTLPTPWSCSTFCLTAWISNASPPPTPC